MFAVKGWSLPQSGPAVQIADPTDKTKKAKEKTKKKAKSKSLKHATGSNSVDMTPAAAAKLKQRERAARVTAVDEQQQQQQTEKRSGAAAAVVVNEQNVHKLWRKFIEGVEADRPGAGAEERRPKKRKRGSGKSAQEQQDGEGGGEEGALPKKRKTLKEKRREKRAATEAVGTSDAPAPAEPTPAADAARQDASSSSKLTPLQQAMRAKLASARFRHINETLYTSPSAASLALFAREPGMFADYHAGFRQQVAVWPANPVDTFIALLRVRAAAKFAKGHSRRALGSTATALLPLPRDRTSGVCTVADLGCGDAKIAATFNHGREAAPAKIRVLSYDLQATTPDVTVADIAHLPLPARAVDVVIFCLALMGTNFLEFVDEAGRVLRPRGELWVAEIKSRFNRPAAAGSAVGRRKQTGGGGAEDAAAAEPGEGEEPEVDGAERSVVPPPYRNFVDALSRRGFVLKAGGLDDGNKMFVRMEFVKLPAQGEAAAAEDEDEASGWGEDGGGVEGRAAQGGTGPGAATTRGKGKGKGKGKQKKTKFIEDELAEEHILKPCVYKLR